MISVGSRDGRKGLEQGFSSIKREMEEAAELEEGEACSYQDDDPSIDPDVALSYIDEKLQNVLGHFQKDFEGAVSAESLGAKFGIYGSFLPSYRRSPVWSHSRTPPRDQNHHTPQSPSALPVEGGHHNPLAPVNVSHLMKHGSASGGSSLSDACKQASQKDLFRQNAKTQSLQSVEECTPKPEVRDRRTLKVRIKVGSDNLSAKKNTALYTGLGLDGSPSSSLDDIPVEGVGLSHSLPFDSFESPAQILQMMTSSPLLGGRFLSPLPDDLMQLSERPNQQHYIVTQPGPKVNRENSVMGRPSYSVKENKTFSGEDSMVFLNKKALSSDDKRDTKDRHIGFNFPLKEPDIDAASCEELVSNALKLPLLSDAYSNVKDSSGVSAKEKLHSNAGDPLESVSTPFSLSEKPNGKRKVAGQLFNDKISVSINEMMTCSGKVVESKSETTHNSANTGTVELKFRKASKTDLNDPGSQRTDKSTLCGDGMVLPRGKEKLSSGDKKRRKKGQVHGFAAEKLAVESAKDGAQVLKDSKFTDTKYIFHKNEVENSSFEKDLKKGKDRYTDFFGDMNDQEADAMDSPDALSRERLKASEVVEKVNLAFEETSKSSVETRGDITSMRNISLESRREITSRTHIRGPATNASLPDNGRPISDPAAVGVDANEKWVQCDKCQKWRLLPPGSNVESLPDKWQCSMQTWLPNMNRCSISEAEGDGAFRARYQLLSDIPNSLHDPLCRLATGVTSADLLEPVVSNNGKMMGKQKKKSKSSSEDFLNPRPSSLKKQQQSAKNRTSKEVKGSSMMNVLDFQQQTKSNDTYLQTNQQKKLEQHRPDCYSDGGHSKSPMVHGKRECEQEFPRNSKRNKTQSMQSGFNNLATSLDQDNEMLGIGTEYGLAGDTARNDQMANTELFSSPNLKDEMDGISPDTCGKLKCQVNGSPAVASMHISKSEGVNTALKKRKGDSFKYPPSSTPSSGKLVDDNEHSSRIRHRMSKPEGKEPSASKRNGKADEKSKSMSERGLDNHESLQKDSTGANAAATSSSSKVSGSLKVKSKFQEVKGSPVESVSSSPLRSSNLDKLALGCKAKVEKGNVQNAVKLAIDSPRNGDYEGSSDQSRLIRKAMETGTHNGSVDPMIDAQVTINGGLLHSNGNGRADSLDPDDGYLSKAQTLNRCVNETSEGEGHIDGAVPHSGKSWMDLASFSKDKNQNSKSNSDKGKVNMPESYDKPQNDTPVHEGRERDRKVDVQENYQRNDDKDQKNTIWNNQEPSIPKSKGQHEYDEKRSSKKFDVEKPEHLASLSTKEISRCSMPSDGGKNKMSNSPLPRQGNDMSTSCTGARPNDLPKEPRANKKVDGQNGTYHVPSKHSMANGHRNRNQDGPSPLRRDSSSQAASSAIKEAKNLKHLADRLKNAGSMESTGLYFEAALKFLHGASLLESGKTENSKHGDMVQAMQIYSSTAKLCKFCAHEYEKTQDMGTAALAYKCMEVAYLRVVYSSHNTASRDRCELQTVLQMVPPGESPSSSASDIDNLNNTATGDKAVQTRSVDSPQLSGNLVIAAKNRPNFSRLLSFAQDVNLAMEASRKSRNCFAAANVVTDPDKSKDGIASIRRALDFNYHDMEGLLRLVRLAKEATSR